MNSAIKMKRLQADKKIKENRDGWEQVDLKIIPIWPKPS